MQSKLSVTPVAPPSSLIQPIRERLSQSLQGKAEIIEKALACFLGGGHLLLQGPPGTGKTSLAKGMAHVFGGSFNRIQMTSDLLPSDVIGMLRVKPSTQEFEFRQGPVFANFVLADEMNRTTPKTQSALLEAMEEHTVTVDGHTYELPQPFFVVATQNPLEFHGVYPFAESQLDRFMMQLNFVAPSEMDELQIYRSPQHGHDLEVLKESPLLTLNEGVSLRLAIKKVHAEESILRFITALVRATREIPNISHGVSVRGGIQFLQACRALAFIRARDFILPKDVLDLAPGCLAHRLFFHDQELGIEERENLVNEITRKIPTPQ